MWAATNIVLSRHASVGPQCSFVQVLHVNADKIEIDAYTMGDLDIVGYNPHKKIAMKMAV